jgi:hypothetical protein
MKSVWKNVLKVILIIKARTLKDIYRHQQSPLLVKLIIWQIIGMHYSLGARIYTNSVGKKLQLIVGRLTE